MSFAQQPALRKPRIAFFAMLILIPLIITYFSLAIAKKDDDGTPDWKLCKTLRKNTDSCVETCTPTPGEQIIGGQMYIKNDDGECVVNTCNTTVGYDLTPTDGLCMPDSDHAQYAMVEDKKKCTHYSSKHKYSRCYLQWVNDAKYSNTPAAGDNYQKLFCKSGKATWCPASTDKGGSKGYYYCGDLDADSFCSS